MAELDTPSGMRDFLPDVMQRREYVLETIKNTFQQWGFLPLETPSMERWETLAGKYGEEGEKLIYHCFNSGNLPSEPGQTVQFSRQERPELALRYDLTVPTARVMAMYGQTLAKPFKRYQIQPVWRGDRPGAGRFREFVQCDVDVIGSTSLLVEAELVAMNEAIFTRLQVPDFTIRVNHRQILRGLVEAVGLAPHREGTVLTAIDKLDKLPPAKVSAELIAKGISPEATEQLLAFVQIKGTPTEVLAQAQTILSQSVIGREGLAELTRLDDLLCGYQLTHYQIDLSLARGLDYYTGTIFEIVTSAKVGSVGGGGRYDQLISTLSARRADFPAAGTSIGLDRLITAMEQLNLFAQLPQPQRILVTYFTDAALAAVSLDLARQLRAVGLNTEIYYGDTVFSPNALRKQLGYANSKQMSHVIVLGPDEVQQGQVALKDLQQRQQVTLAISEVVAHLSR